MIKFLKQIAPVLVLVFILLMPCLTFAESMTEKLKDVGGQSGFNTSAKTNANSLPAQVGNIIYKILGLLGVIFIGLMIYAGILWMIAAGDESKVTKSKDTMRRAIIGLIIVVGSYAISQFIVRSLVS